MNVSRTDALQACLLGGGALPMAFIVLWDRTSTFAAIVSPLVGLCSGLIAWMVATKRSRHAGELPTVAEPSSAPVRELEWFEREDSFVLSLPRENPCEDR